jgi:hypothetical protein
MPGMEEEPEVPDMMVATREVETEDGIEFKTITQRAKVRINVRVGAGMPKNKAFVYSVMKEAFGMQIIMPQELRTFIVEELGLPIDEKIPNDLIREMIQKEVEKVQQQQQKQPGQGQQSIRPSSSSGGADMPPGSQTTNPTGVHAPGGEQMGPDSVSSAYSVTDQSSALRGDMRGAGMGGGA